MSTTLDSDSLYRLMAWLSPAYPTGAFSYSHGIEYAIEAKLVTDRASLVDWIAWILRRGAGQVDAVLLIAAYQAAHDPAALDDVATLAAALRGSAEAALESAQQGHAFLATTRAAWPEKRLDTFAARWGERALALPVAVALACVDRVPLDLALRAYLQSFGANLVSAGVRLIPLGQTDGQIAIAALAAAVDESAEAALATPLEEIGSAAPMVDWTSMRHETQYTRLFRS
ncbi:MAG TPA: urease accessory protein UreF [Alphaproteobacteria bacterium]|nr:urease accessory protein UreF [Alphaproteobacteria bacterium]